MLFYRQLAFSLSLSFWLTCQLASAQVIFVTTSADTTDIAADAGFEQLPGPDGVISFREALRVSDNEIGHQTIGFQIPEHDWYLSDIFPGLVLLQGNTNWLAFEPVTIDGTTQTSFTGDTNPSGHEIVLYGLGLVVGGDGIYVTGLHNSTVSLSDSNQCIVTDNSGSMDIEVSVGSENLITGNEADTIELAYSNFNVVAGNTTRRVRISGGGTLFGPAMGNRIGGPEPADRNFITGWGNYGEHGFPAGTTLDLFGTRDTVIENNYIGVTPDGMAIGNPASTTGIGIITDNRQVTIRNNLIATHAIHANGSGDFGAAIYIDGYEGAQDIHIVGNTLGLNANGAAELGGLHGIWINDTAGEYTDNIVIGGQLPGEGNIIAGHVSTGVLMEGAPGVSPSGGIRLSGNLIFGNGEISIDLMPNTWDFGHTENDALDADIGANWLQNHPVLQSAIQSSDSINVTGVLNSSTSRKFTVEFFASSLPDPSGFGQAEVFIGSTTIFTDTQGNATFDVELNDAVPEGWLLTSTATDETTGATSEFSAGLEVQISTNQPGDVNQDGEINLRDIQPFVVWLASGEYFLLADINADGELDLRDIAPFVELLAGN